MIPTFFRSFFQLIRLALNLGTSTKETSNIDEIYRQLEMLQLDFSNTEAVSTACIYLADPHKLPVPARNANDNPSRRESDAENEISQHYFHCEGTNDELDQLSKNLQNITENINISNSKSPNTGESKQRIFNDHLDESSPVEQFRNTSLVASTPLSTKSNNGYRRQMVMIKSAVRTKVDELKQRTILNLSVYSNDSMNTTNSRDETKKREQCAIAKHIARIRKSSAKLGSSKEALPSFNNTRYHSMCASFGSSGSTSFS
ncbi:hypothetical protein QQG55_2095 [Brugia pahangi]